MFCCLMYEMELADLIVVISVIRNNIVQEECILKASFMS